MLKYLLMSLWQDRDLDSLVEALLALKSPKEVRMFLRDLMTEPEIVEFGKRWRAAQLLDRQVPYTVIEEETGLSSATIARVSKWLQRGKGGYRLMLRRFGRKE